jgi:oxygen-independent coproporphyrinogen-3 oxidase
MVHWHSICLYKLDTLVLPLSLYIHIPWCIRKCPYCDFNSHAAKSNIPEAKYISVLLEDLASDLQQFTVNTALNSIFIGGGTPSLFAPESIDLLLQGIKQQMAFQDKIEITLEANPGTFESQKFIEFRALGINRLSIGIQSFNETLLKRLGRVHSASEAIKSAEIAHKSGFDNFNLDLMYGLPGADPQDSKNDIQTAISLKPAHISFYQLTLEPNTYFHKYPPPLPDDDAIFATQVTCQKILADHHYHQYEISAYSRPGMQCQHNLNYWQFGDYLGIGAGAHGKFSQALPDRVVRSIKCKNPEHYLTRKKSFGNTKLVLENDLPLEFMMNHLRLKQGFDSTSYQNRTGLPLETLEPALSVNLSQGLLIKQGNRYVCTDRGWLFLDTLLQPFVA